MKRAYKVVFIILCVLLLLVIFRQFQFVLLEKTAELLGTYSLQNMEMEITYNPEKARADFAVEMEIIPASQNPRSFLVFAFSPHLEIKGMQINGREIGSREIWALKFIGVPRDLRNEEFTLALQYEGPHEGIFGRSPGYSSEEGAYFDILSLWQPVVLGPYLENFRDVNQVVRLNSPQPMLGVTGGDLIEVRKEDGFNQTIWQSGMLSSIVFHPFEEFFYLGSSRFMNLFLPPELNQLTEDLAELADDIFSQYNNKLGPAGPENFTLAIVDSKQKGTFYPDGLVLLNRASLEKYAEDQENRDFHTLLAHEIGHYWFHFETISLANLWGGQWYMEGFTEYLAIWSTGQRFGELDYDNRIRNAAGRLQRAPATKPLIQYSYLEYSPVPYYKSVLMLDGIKRTYGEETLFNFIREIRSSPETDLVKAMEISAHKNFQENYSYFFRHWLQGSTPVELFIEQVIEGSQDQLYLVVTSNQELRHLVDIIIEYPWGARVINPRIARGANEIILPVEENYLSIRLDPHGRLFRLEEAQTLRFER